MIATVQLVDVGAGGASALLTRSPRPGSIPGLRYGRTVLAMPLSRTVLRVPRLTRVGMLGLWDDEAAFEEFLDTHPLAARLASGWQARLAPVRATGSWPGLPDELGSEAGPSPAAVLTLGRLRITQAGRFLRASAPAEAAALDAPGLVWATALTRPPLVATCSLWRSTTDLAAYAYRPGHHQAAVTTDQDRPFHHESAFVRFRPISLSGHLDGTNPLAEECIPAE